MMTDKDEIHLLKADGKEGYGTSCPKVDVEIEEKPHNPDDGAPVTAGVLLQIGVCVLGHMGRGLGINSFGPTLPDLRQVTHITVAESAFVFISQSLGILVGSLAAKKLLQRFNNKLIIATFLLIQAICSMLIPAFPSFPVMCIMIVGQGMGIGVACIGMWGVCIKLGGKKRTSMYLQAAYAGVSAGSILGPFMAKPFLSKPIYTPPFHPNINESMDEEMSASFSLLNNHGNGGGGHAMYTPTHVLTYYIIMGSIVLIPSVGFYILYCKAKQGNGSASDDKSVGEHLSPRTCTSPLATAIVLLFAVCLLFFGTQDVYSNLLTTFVVLGPLKLSKAQGVYLTSLFWSCMCFGRVNGIWIAKFLSPFKMLMIAFTGSIASSIGLIALADQHVAALWVFTATLGLSFSTINGATVSWVAAHLPQNNYILSVMMIGRCSGLFVVPTIVTAIFSPLGAMSMMYTIGITCVLMLVCLSCAQLLSRTYGVNGKLHTKYYDMK